jgi:hypothetical protein
MLAADPICLIIKKINKNEKQKMKINNVVGHQDDLHFIHVIPQFLYQVFCKWVSLLLSYLLTFFFLSYSLFSLYSFSLRKKESILIAKAIKK